MVDIENVVGGAITSPAAVAWAKQALCHAVHIERADHIVIGTSHVGLLPVGCAWPNLRYVVRSGPDGADLALLEVLGENLPGRFDRLVVASGDGIFSDAVAGLGRQGVHVTVVAHPDSLSRRLQLAAAEVIFLDGHWFDPASVVGARTAA